MAQTLRSSGRAGSVPCGGAPLTLIDGRRRLQVDAEGNSTISTEDLAVVLLDEAEEQQAPPDEVHCRILTFGKSRSARRQVQSPSIPALVDASHSVARDVRTARNNREKSSQRNPDRR